MILHCAVAMQLPAGEYNTPQLLTRARSNAHSSGCDHRGGAWYSCRVEKKKVLQSIRRGGSRLRASLAASVR
jgi:hypothetical protein